MSLLVLVMVVLASRVAVGAESSDASKGPPKGSAASAGLPEPPRRWTEEEASAWYKKQPRLVGFVNGRTQAQFPWWNKPNGPVHEAGWFHDVLHADGRPYRPEEIEAIRKTTADKRMNFTTVPSPNIMKGTP